MNALVAKLRASREFWVGLDATHRVRLIRPPEAELGTLKGSSAFDLAARYATGWEGFTEACLLGPAVGASDPLEFFPELWAEVVRDRTEWATVCANAIVEAVGRHLNLQEAAEKN